MTVSVTDSSKRFHGAGSTGPFTWTWRFLDNADIYVYRIADPDEDNPSTEVHVLLAEGDDYTLTGAGTYTGGSLTLADALAVGTDLLVERVTAALQETSIRNQGNNFRPEVHEEAFDRLTMMIQDRERNVSTAAADIADLKERVAALEAAVDALEASAGVVVVTGGDGVPKTFVDASVTPVVANLPEEGEVIIIKTDDTANAVTITPAEGHTVLRGETFEITLQDESIRLVLEGTNWYRVG